MTSATQHVRKLFLQRSREKGKGLGVLKKQVQALRDTTLSTEYSERGERRKQQG